MAVCGKFCQEMDVGIEDGSLKILKAVAVAFFSCVLMPPLIYFVKILATECIRHQMSQRLGQDYWKKSHPFCHCHHKSIYYHSLGYAKTL